MADRDITGSVRANRKADAGQAPRDGIEAISLRVNGKDALGISSGNPAVEIGLGRHCFILAAVNGGGRVQPGRFWFWPRCGWRSRSEEHTSELQSLMRSSYAGFCLKKKNNRQITSM